MSERILLVSNRLPITIGVRDGRPTFNESIGGLATGLSGPHRERGGLWFGWPGDLPPSSPQVRATIDAELRARRLVPIALSSEDLESYYEGFANGVLWPLLHYLVDAIPQDASGWARYVAVNQRFADLVASHHRAGDLVWVHDYHLALVPAMLRARVPDARIGFFLHIPFPPAEVFRILPWRAEVLRGLLGADLIGFHTPGYLRHFLASVNEIGGLDVVGSEVRMPSRRVRCGAFPMGIDAAAFASMAASAGVRREAERLMAASPRVRTLLGIDRLDYTKGIPRRLAAFERMLEQWPASHGQVQLLQIAVPSREKTPAYVRFKRRLDELVGRINGRFASPSWTPIRYLHRSFSADRLVALYRAADVMLVTPLRDGMNLVAKEFAASRDDLGGVLVLSEFAGAAEELREAVIVNPYDIDAVAAALRSAIEMPAEERARRMGRLRERVFAHDVHRWARSFLQQLTEESLGHAALPAVSPLPLERLRAAESLLVFLDYDGTLVPFFVNPDDARPDAATLEAVERLALRPGVEVHIVSGRPPSWLEQIFSRLPVTLHAEHGVWSRACGGLSWRRNGVATEAAERALARARSPFEEFVRSNRGAFLEEKSAGLVLHYRGVASEQVGEEVEKLRRQLIVLLDRSPLVVLSGHAVLEVRPAGLDKGSIARTRLEVALAPSEILAIGDDRTDEDLFAALPATSVTVRVGHGPSLARWRLEGPAEVRRFLEALGADHGSAHEG